MPREIMDIRHCSLDAKSIGLTYSWTMVEMHIQWVISKPVLDHLHNSAYINNLNW